MYLHSSLLWKLRFVRTCWLLGVLSNTIIPTLVMEIVTKLAMMRIAISITIGESLVMMTLVLFAIDIMGV